MNLDKNFSSFGAWDNTLTEEVKKGIDNKLTELENKAQEDFNTFLAVNNLVQKKGVIMKSGRC